MTLRWNTSAIIDDITIRVASKSPHEMSYLAVSTSCHPSVDRGVRNIPSMMKVYVRTGSEMCIKAISRQASTCLVRRDEAITSGARRPRTRSVE